MKKAENVEQKRKQNKKQEGQIASGNCWPFQKGHVNFENALGVIHWWPARRHISQGGRGRWGALRLGQPRGNQPYKQPSHQLEDISCSWILNVKSQEVCSPLFQHLVISNCRNNRNVCYNEPLSSWARIKLCVVRKSKKKSADFVNPSHTSSPSSFHLPPLLTLVHHITSNLISVSKEFWFTCEKSAKMWVISARCFC